MAQQKLYYFYDVTIPYLVATWWRPYHFLLHFNLCNIPSVILYAVGISWILVMRLSCLVKLRSLCISLRHLSPKNLSMSPFGHLALRNHWAAMKSVGLWNG